MLIGYGACPNLRCRMAWSELYSASNFIALGQSLTIIPIIASNLLSNFIYLASQSPRRQELLKQIGVRYEMLLPTPGEDVESIEAPLPHEKAHDYVKRVTLAKASLALTRWRKSGLPWAPILCADTTVSLPNSENGEILGKPNDANDARRILEMLSGKTHEVLTAVALISNPENAPHCVVQISEVEFATLSAEQIDAYIAACQAVKTKYPKPE